MLNKSVISPANKPQSVGQSTANIEVPSVSSAGTSKDIRLNFSFPVKTQGLQTSKNYE